MPVINENSLKKVIMEILKKAGSDEGEASIVADHLVMSNLCGHDSHGLICVPIYLEYICDGNELNQNVLRMMSYHLLTSQIPSFLKS